MIIYLNLYLNFLETSSYTTLGLIWNKGNGKLSTYAMLCYAKSLQSCLTLCDPIDSSPLGSAVPGILQAIILEWVAISFSNAWKRKVKVKSLSRVWLLATPWTAAYQAPLSMDFPGKSIGVGCHCLLRVNIYDFTLQPCQEWKTYIKHASLLLF